MSLWSRIRNVFRGDALSRDIDEELQSHIEEAVAQGRDAVEARRAFGSELLRREESRDIRLAVWLDSLCADAVFGWRQLRKRPVTSAAAILSLALAIGACTSAFRLIDALLLRPLPIRTPDRLYALIRYGIGPDGKPRAGDSYEYPLFRQMSAAVKEQAELLAISYMDRVDLTYGSDQEIEQAHLQYVSGSMFGAFGLRPAAGRLIDANDDVKPGGHPYAVISYDYWTRRFGRDPKAIGRSFRLGADVSPYEIVGVAEEPFTGTEPGTVTDIFLPTMMNAFGISHPDSAWFRAFAVLKPSAAADPIGEKLYAVFRAVHQQRVKELANAPALWRSRFLSERLSLEPAGSGLSEMQKNNRLSLAALGVLVALVLLIACANVANLMTAQAAARAREMALRVSIGAGRLRLVQLVLVESAWLASLAAAIGGWFAWWAAPFVVRMINPPSNPARLMLPADWRVLGFGLALTLAVTFLFGLAPALRASAVRPVSALKGGDDPLSRRRQVRVLIAVQVAFCFLVHFVAGLFTASFDRLANQSTGFSAERLLALDTVSDHPQPAAYWDQVGEHLRDVPGVEKVALAGWPLLSGNGWNGFVAINGGAASEDLDYFLGVSPGWSDIMKIPLIGGRDFRAGETYPGAAIVNQTFVKHYFGGENPVGKWFEKADSSRRIRMQIVGVVADARYRNMREPLTPTIYVPLYSLDAKGAPQPLNHATFLVRTTAADPLSLASVLRREVALARPGFRAANISSQQELILQHTVRERLLAMLGVFFAIVALLLAGVGLYGVLDYSVLQRRREIGIRMAVGAQAGDIARRVTAEVFAMVATGAVAGLGLGMASVRFIETLFYGVKATDPLMLALPSLAILAAAVLAAVPPVIRAVRLDPFAMLRSD